MTNKKKAWVDFGVYMFKKKKLLLLLLTLLLCSFIIICASKIILNAKEVKEETVLEVGDIPLEEGSNLGEERIIGFTG